MIAKIGRSANLYGALAYNQLKVEQKNATVLFMHKMIETANGDYSVKQLVKSFEAYLIANRNTEKPAVHISLNPDPKDRVSDELFGKIALDYMQEMGYKNQPFIVFKHTDIGRTHIHIVSVCVDEQGRKISDKFEKKRSMTLCRELEKRYGLIPATDKGLEAHDKIFRPVDYLAGDIKSQISAVVRHLPTYYKFQTFGQYNALLSLFNITAEKIEHQTQQGLCYIPLNEKGERAGHPLKASLFGKNAGLTALEAHFAKSKALLENTPVQKSLQQTITTILRATDHESAFRSQLLELGIHVVIRKNDTGRIYGITFIDHHSKTLWNGSQLGKELSTNAIHDYWNKDSQTSIPPGIQEQPKAILQRIDFVEEEAHQVFNSLDTDQHDNGFITALAGLTPEALHEDYEELNFEQSLKKRMKRKKNK